MTIDYIRKYYDVPAKVGGRVEYSGTTPPQMGTICGAQGAHLRIRLDGAKHADPYHPTWQLRYLDAATPAQSSKGGSEMADTAEASVPSEIHKACMNCQHFDMGGKRDAKGRKTSREGQCHNGMSQRFRTMANGSCSKGFYPDITRWPLRAGPGGIR